MVTEMKVVWQLRGRDVVMSGSPEEIVDEMRESGLIQQGRQEYKDAVADRVSEMYGEFIPTRGCGEFLLALIQADLIKQIN